MKSKLFNRYVLSAAYYTHDGNKNVSDRSETSAHHECAPFGAVTTQRGESAAANPWRFSSEYAEDETGTAYYNYRHYEPGMGRWIQRDPVEHLNMYLYSTGGIDVENYAVLRPSENYPQKIGVS